MKSRMVQNEIQRVCELNVVPAALSGDIPVCVTVMNARRGLVFFLSLKQPLGWPLHVNILSGPRTSAQWQIPLQSSIYRGMPEMWSPPGMCEALPELWPGSGSYIIPGCHINNYFII